MYKAAPYTHGEWMVVLLVYIHLQWYMYKADTPTGIHTWWRNGEWMVLLVCTYTYNDMYKADTPTDIHTWWRDGEWVVLLVYIHLQWYKAHTPTDIYTHMVKGWWLDGITSISGLALNFFFWKSAGQPRLNVRWSNGSLGGHAYWQFCIKKNKFKFF